VLDIDFDNYTLPSPLISFDEMEEMLIREAIYRHGDFQRLADRVRSGQKVGPKLRELIAEIIEGGVKRAAGRPRGSRYPFDEQIELDVRIAKAVAKAEGRLHGNSARILEEVLQHYPHVLAQDPNVRYRVANRLRRQKA
jgi:hypothetical protein